MDCNHIEAMLCACRVPERCKTNCQSNLDKRRRLDFFPSRLCDNYIRSRAKHSVYENRNCGFRVSFSGVKKLEGVFGEIFPPGDGWVCGCLTSLYVMR